jgi:Arm DNA-binding domain
METPTTFRFTAPAIAALKPRATRQDYWDLDTPGFGIRVTATGIKSWFLRYRPNGSRTHRRWTIGRYSSELGLANRSRNTTARRTTARPPAVRRGPPAAGVPRNAWSRADQAIRVRGQAGRSATRATDAAGIDALRALRAVIQLGLRLRRGMLRRLTTTDTRNAPKGTEDRGKAIDGADCHRARIVNAHVAREALAREVGGDADHEHAGGARGLDSSGCVLNDDARRRRSVDDGARR